MYRSPGTYLKAEENSGRSQLEDSRRLSDSHRLKWCPMPPNEVGRIAQQVRKEGEKNEGKYGVSVPSPLSRMLRRP